MMTGTVCFEQEKTIIFNAKFGDLGDNGDRGQNVSSKVPYLESLTLIAYSLCNFYGATMMIKGSLLLSAPIVKHFQSKRNLLKSRFGPKFDGFWGINKGLKLNSSFITPKSTYPCVISRLLRSHVKIHQQV